MGAKLDFIPRADSIFRENRTMKIHCRTLIVLQIVAGLFVVPTASAVDNVKCHAMQEKFNRLYISGFQVFDRLMDQCKANTSADSPERVSCIQQAGKKASGHISVQMNELKVEWRAVGCPGKPSAPDL